MTQNVQSRTRLNSGIDMPWMGLVVFKVEEGSELVEAVKAALSTVPEHRHRCGIRQRNERRSGNSRGAGRERTEQGTFSSLRKCGTPTSVTSRHSPPTRQALRSWASTIWISI